MDKQKIIKIVIVAVIAICAIIYYFSNNNDIEEIDDNSNTNTVIVENKNTEDKSEKQEISKIKVYVTGEVNSPGVIELEEGARIEDAIEGAGGIKAEANLKDINLAYEVSDGEKIYIPNLSEISEEQSENENNNISENKESSSSKGKININKASVSELTTVPGIGESTAQKIVDYRDENGKFKSVEDIKNVSGIGNSKYEKLKDNICVK